MTFGAINEATGAAPRLRLDINIGNLAALPAWSSGPHDEADRYDLVRRAGYEGLQHYLRDEAAARAGLRLTGMGRVLGVDDAVAIARRDRDLGFEATTLHVGHGLETDDEAARLIEAVVAASAREAYPLYVETHRGTVTQDIRRTLDLVTRFPSIRFNADLSHWYTGLAMTYGDFDARLAAMTPILDRVCYVHGRIGDPCCMQVCVGGREDAPYVNHFRTMWQRCFEGFLCAAGPGDVVVFAPELLPAAIVRDGAAHPMYYARLRDDGEEESDRWHEASVLCGIAKDCFEAAQCNKETRS